MVHRIDVPTLIIWGANDRVFPMEYAYAYQQLIPGSKAVIIPECGHIPQAEKPAVFVSELTDFIAGMRIAA
jgi:pimeloyl-ACP methyl ester carboxylesterase